MLPQGFTRVEYIESTGTQYIDTGKYASQNTKARLRFYPTVLQSTCFAGARSSASSRAFTINSGSANTRQYAAMGSSGNESLGTHTVGWHEVQLENGSFLYDGVAKEVSTSEIGTFTTAYSIYLFALNSNGASLHSTCRISDYELWENDAKSFEFVPCMDSTGAGRAWDEIGDALLSQSGAFSVGSPIVPGKIEGLEHVESDTGIAMRWNAVQDANEYIIKRDGVQIASVYGDVTSYTDIGVFGEHVYTVTPYNGIQPGGSESIEAERLPEAPKNVTANTNGDLVNISWDVVPGVEGYTIYRDWTAVANITDTKYTDALMTPEAVEYAVSSYVGEYRSEPSEMIRAEEWGNVDPALIYDRTAGDVEYAKEIIKKCIYGESLTEYERQEYDSGLRGCYNTSDVNRVEYHTRELQSILNANGYNIRIDTKLWAKSDIMRYSDIVRYLGNIKSILDAFGRSSNAPPLPTIEQWINYIAANDIERILFVTRELVYGAIAMFRRAGTFAAGNDYHAQIIRRA